ncbi:MAG: M20/M25/M40 family metallo-hydrolase [Haloarculaceae archaeon]
MRPAPHTEYLSAERVFDIASDLLAIDTQNPSGETRPLDDGAETFLTALGLAAECVVVDPAKPNVLATVPGERDRTLLSNGHLDTVPFEVGEWTYDPLGERDDDRLYGRGATDVKGPLAAMLYVAEALSETETTTPVDLAFAFVSDEETGGYAAVYARIPAAYDEAVG